jgi:hypothetical protein
MPIRYVDLFRTTLFPFGVVCLVAGGCTSRERVDVPSMLVIRDSAGIQIVENGPIGDPPLTRGSWSIDSLPAVVIGSAESLDTMSQLGKVSGVARMRDGTMLVADWEAGAVRLFDTDGHFTRTLVRRGGGPAELYEPYGLYHTADDSVFATGKEDGSVLVFAPDLSLVRTIRTADLSNPRGRTTSPSGIWRTFDDGSVLVNTAGYRRKNRPTTGVFVEVDSVHFARERIGIEPLADYGWQISSRGVAWQSGTGSGGILEQFHGQGYVDVRGTTLYYADGERLEFHVFDATGRLRRIVRASAATPPIPRALERQVAGIANIKVSHGMEGMRFKATEGDLPNGSVLPSNYPALDALHLDARGNAWVHVAIGSKEPPSKYWLVFDTAGVFRHAISDRFALQPPIEIGDDYILGVSKDSFDVQRVVRFTIRK